MGRDLRNRPTDRLDRNAYALPLRREVSAVLHFLHTARGTVRTGLDVGFTNAGVSQTLRQSGGYWMTVEPSPRRRDLVAMALDAETVLSAGQNGELPFEDKQFDVVVLAHGVLPQREDMAAAMIRECHRVLRPGGHFILTVEYRKRYGVAAALNRQRAVSGAGGRYNETEVFRLLKDGFDVLGFRYTCRFWVQLVRQWGDRRREERVYGMAHAWLRLLYMAALALDGLLVFTRGYQMTVHGRRKGWRGRQSSVMSGSTPVSDAILSDPRREGRAVSLARFR